jgi:branched-subunit amino acid aminotransferase/4-amino-4-deoxychorismate lyase
VRVTVRETTLHDADLFGADEMFLTSTTREIVPIVMVNDSQIGDGLPGATTRRLLAEFRRQVAEMNW